MKDKEKGYEGFGILASDFHHYANDIYDRWDEGLKPKKKSMEGLLQACKATQPEPFQIDRAPEDRTEYNGLRGMVQQQKDQNYLMS